MSRRRNNMGDPFAQTRRDDMTLEQIDRELFGALKNAEGPTMLALEVLRLDGGTQPREKLDEVTIAEYAEAMERGDEFPPLTVFYDGEAYWLADGFHRYHAAKATGQAEMACDVRQGTRRDAVLHSVGVNAEHGLRRTNADKRRAVMTLLRDPEWGKWSDREIARKCKVSAPFVAKLRKELSVNGLQIERTVRRGDTVYTMRTGGISEAARERAEEAKKKRADVIELLQEARGWMEFNKLVRALGERKNIRAEHAEEAVRELVERGEAALMGVGEEIWVTFPEEAQAVEQERRRQEARPLRYVDEPEFDQTTVWEEPAQDGEAADFGGRVDVTVQQVVDVLSAGPATYQEIRRGVGVDTNDPWGLKALRLALDVLTQTGRVQKAGTRYELVVDAPQEPPSAEPPRRADGRTAIPGEEALREAYGVGEPVAEDAVRRLERLLGDVNGAIFKLVDHVRRMEKRGESVPDHWRDRVLSVARGAERRAYDGEWLPYALSAVLDETTEDGVERVVHVMNNFVLHATALSRVLEAVASGHVDVRGNARFEATFDTVATQIFGGDNVQGLTELLGAVMERMRDEE